MKPLDITWERGFGESIVLKCPKWGVETVGYWGKDTFGDMYHRSTDGLATLQLWNGTRLRPEVTLKMVLEWTEELRSNSDNLRLQQAVIDSSTS